MTARDFAINAHGNQRYGSEPYVFHLDQVVAVLHEFGYNYNYGGLADAAYLHDVLADTWFDLSSIEAAFGKWTADVVLSVSPQTGGPSESRAFSTMLRISKSQPGILVKLAERIANVRRCISHPCTNGANMIRRYRDEHSLFKNCLQANFGPTDLAMWAELDRLLLKAARPLTIEFAYGCINLSGTIPMAPPVCSNVSSPSDPRGLTPYGAALLSCAGIESGNFRRYSAHLVKADSFEWTEVVSGLNKIHARFAL